MIYDENGALLETNNQQIAQQLVMTKMINDNNMKNKASQINWKYVVPLEPDAIKNFEEKYKYKIPSDLKQLITKYNDGSPDKRVFSNHKFKGLVFGGLISFNKENEYHTTIYMYLSIKNDSIDDFIKDGKIVMLPFGVTPSGDIFCIRKGSVVLWLHEEMDDNVIKLADSLNEFLSKLHE